MAVTLRALNDEIIRVVILAALALLPPDLLYALEEQSVTTPDSNPAVLQPPTEQTRNHGVPTPSTRLCLRGA